MCDNASNWFPVLIRFWRKLKRKTVAKTHLSGVCYGLLGEVTTMVPRNHPRAWFTISMQEFVM